MKKLKKLLLRVKFDLFSQFNYSGEVSKEEAEWALAVVSGRPKSNPLIVRALRLYGFFHIDMDIIASNMKTTKSHVRQLVKEGCEEAWRMLN